MSDPVYDIFLSYNSRDRAAVAQLAVQLRQAGFTPWLDAWDLPAGGDWQDGIDHGLRHSRGCAVFLGPHGFGDWQQQEMKVASSMAAHDPAFRFFLVLLPGAPDPLDSTSLPAFINLRGRINLREGYTAPRQFQHLTNAILGVAMGPSGPAAPDLGESPYRGLEPFDATHAEFFFGRNAEIRKLLDKLRAAPFLAVIGPSGSGKSSLVLAGLIPALRNGQLPGSAAWPIVTMAPGPHPVESLAVALDTLDPQRSRNQLLEELQGSPQGLRLEATALLRERPRGARLVLVVDQFEEVFTLCRDEAERATILNLLPAAAQPDGPCVVVITMRADFYPRVTEYPALATEVESHQLLVGALTREGLTAAIEQPAFRKGLQFEPGLVSTMLADMGTDAGALPLLQYALDELWKRQHGGLLTLEGYRASGGVGEAIATRANAVFESLTPEQQAVARRVMLRLTQPGEATEDTRRRAELDELVTGEAERPSIEAAVNALVAARLLTASRDDLTGAPQVDVAHEALIRAWPRLRQWLDEDRQGLLVHRRLTEAAQEWQRADRDPDLLYRGSRLAEAAAFSRLQPDALNERERTFLAESSALREREQAAASEAAAARERLRKRTLVGLGAFSAVALLLALLAGWQWREAGQQAGEAQRQTGIAQEQAAAARRAEDEAQRQALVASNAETTAQAEADRAAQQAAVASTAQVVAQHQAAAAATAEVTAQHEAQIALSRQLAAQSATDLGDPALKRLLAAEAYTMNPADLDIQRALFAVTTDEPALRGLLNGQSGDAGSLAFSPDGTWLASGSIDGSIYLWDLRTQELAAPPLLSTGAGVDGLAFSPDGSVLAYGTATGAIQLVDAGAWKPLDSGITTANGVFDALAFSPDSRTLAVTGSDGVIQFWDVAGAQLLGETRPEHDGDVLAMTFTPDGSQLISGGYQDDTIRFWNLDTMTQEGAALEAGQTGVSGIATSPDGKTFYTAGTDGTLRRWDIPTRKPLGVPLAGDGTALTALVQSQDGSTLVTGSSGGHVRAWADAQADPVARDLYSSKNAVFALALTPDGATLALGGSDPLITLWDTTPPLAPLFLDLMGMHNAGTDLAYSSDGTVIATGSYDGEILLWDRTTGTQLGPPLHGVAWTDGVIPPRIMTLAFSPDGSLLAAGRADGQLFIWDIATGREYRPHWAPLQGDATIYQLAFTPEGQWLAVAGGDGTVRLIRLDDPAADLTLYQDPQRIQNVDLDPVRRILAAPGSDGTLRFWDVATQQQVGEALTGAPGNLSSLAFIRNGQAIAVGTRDGEVQYWSVPGGTLLQTIEVAPDANSLRLVSNQDGSLLAGVSGFGDIMLWSTSEPAPAVQHVATITTTDALAFSPDGEFLAFFDAPDDATRTVSEWDITAAAVASEFPVLNTVTVPVISANGAVIATGTQTGIVRVWVRATRAVLFSQQISQDSPVKYVALNAAGTLLATVGGDGRIQFWDIASGQPLGDVIAGPPVITSVAFNADGSRFAVGTGKITLFVWDVKTGQSVLDTTSGDEPDVSLTDEITSLAFSPDSAGLLAVSTVRFVQFRSPDHPEMDVAPIRKAGVARGVVAFSPDGRDLGYTDGQDGIGIWNMERDQPQGNPLVGEIGPVNGLGFSPDSRLIARGSMAGGVQVWDTTSPAPLGSLRLTDLPVAGVAFTSDMNDLVAIDTAGNVGQWPTTPGQWVEQACRVAHRNLSQAEWAQYIGNPDDPHRPYHQTCSQFPAGAPVAVSPAGSATPVPAGARS